MSVISHTDSIEETVWLSWHTLQTKLTRIKKYAPSWWSSEKKEKKTTATYTALIEATNSVQQNQGRVEKEINKSKTTALFGKQDVFLELPKKLRLSNSNQGKHRLPVDKSCVECDRHISKEFTQSFTDTFNQRMVAAIALTEKGAASPTASGAAAQKAPAPVPAPPTVSEIAAQKAPAPAPAPAVKVAGPPTSTSGAAAQKAPAPPKPGR